ncbi:hypothetical protein [Peribacillus simplex]|uniref:hypothetical protein n=1 Tax=Peribacillus simplex TaxID=1478 RepID=UPI003D290251
MTKTKLFSGYFENDGPNRKFIEPDLEMNRFLSDNPVDVIDIKLTSAPDQDGQIWYAALMIYKEDTTND